MGDTIFSSKEGEGRIGGDVVSYVEYTIGALYEGAEKKFVVLATGFWASLTIWNKVPLGKLRRYRGNNHTNVFFTFAVLCLE